MVRSTFRTPARCNFYMSPLDDYGRIGPTAPPFGQIPWRSLSTSPTKKEDLNPLSRSELRRSEGVCRLGNPTHSLRWSCHYLKQPSSYTNQRRSKWLWTSYPESFSAPTAKSCFTPPGCFEHEDLYRREQWRKAQFLADCFWKRWIREYIPTLEQRQKWIREKDNLKIGDVVLVVDNNSPRGRWLLGRVIKTFPGQDSRVRVAEIKTKNSTLTRPISLLCLVKEAV